MVEVKKYQLPATALIPNSPQPLLHYPGLLSKNGDCTAAKVHDMYYKNGWQTQWIFRYVLTGTATIRFGVADTIEDLEESTHGSGQETGGIELQAKAGDVFILPAGTAHKTFDTTPGEFKLLTPGDGHSINADNVREALDNVELSGFTMIGSYPKDGGSWDSAKGGENEGEYEKVWSVPKPEFDPVLGDAAEGLCTSWQ